MADAEDKDVQAFNELQKKLIENAENQKAAQQQLQAAQQARRRSELTARELSSLSDETPTYAATGKAYFRTPRQQLISQLEDQTKRSSAEIANLKDSEANLNGALTGIECEIRELLQSSQRLAEAFSAIKSN